jgi:hypothetical protein
LQTAAWMAQGLHVRQVLSLTGASSSQKLYHLPASDLQPSSRPPAAFFDLQLAFEHLQLVYARGLRRPALDTCAWFMSSGCLSWQ